MVRVHMATIGTLGRHEVSILGPSAAIAPRGLGAGQHLPCLELEGRKLGAWSGCS